MDYDRHCGQDRRPLLPIQASFANAAQFFNSLLDGHAAIGLAAVSIGQAIFVGGGRTSIEVGINGLSTLIAYPASRPINSLLQRLGEQPDDLVNQAAPAVPQIAGPAEART
jgi:mannose-6-phosphate isomerase